LAAALLAWALSGAAAAHGAIPVSPPDGEKTSGTPTLAWGPAPGDEANRVELARSPEVDADGAFVDDPDKRTVLLDSGQTSYTVPAGAPLVAGTWYWHVETVNFEADPCCSRWSDVRRIVVADEPIVLSSFRIGFLRGLDQVVMRVAYADNSADLAARYRVVFSKRRGGRRLATIKGKLTRASFQDDGRAFASARRPKRLRRGKRYFARLELRDAAGHVARSHHVRIRL
jgi:hypothetical protein